jgi:hemoglobin-like flavoprotein
LTDCCLKITFANFLNNILFQATKKNKGKQREALRDFITTLMQRIHGKETLQSAGSELAKKDPRVMDIAASSSKR